MKKNSLILILLFISFHIKAQDFVTIPNHIKIDSLTQSSIIQNLDSLYKHINIGKIDTSLITPLKRDFTLTIFKKLHNYELKKDSAQKEINEKQLINIYPISKNQHAVSIAYLIKNKEELPILYFIVNLIAEKNGHKVTFSTPLKYLTKYWKTKQIGNITYHYENELNEKEALFFDKKNTQIANLFDLEPQKMDYYMCENYQKIIKLTGFEYSSPANGYFIGGYGVTANTIFMNHEDFSHDAFHYYSELVNKQTDRNWIAEEGLAYSLGNGYYTDQNGKMTTQKMLIKELKNYLNQNRDTTFWDLFEGDYPIFDDIAKDLSVRAVISSLIVDEIMNKKGKEGMMKITNSGGGKNRLANYMKAIDEMLGINKQNFNTQLARLTNKKEYD